MVARDPAAHPVRMTQLTTAGRALEIAARAGRDFLYLAIGLGTSIAAFTVWLTGVTVSLTLVFFIVGLPAILGSAIAFRWTAELDRRNAVWAIGRPLRGRYRDHRGERFLARVSGTLRDPQTWWDLLWLVYHSLVGFAFGAAAVALVGQAIGTALMPVWYWAIPDGVDVGLFHVHQLWLALAVVPAAIPLGAITIALMRAMTLAHGAVAEAFLERG